MSEVAGGLFELAVTETFSAAHWLPGYQGKCAGLHGHNYRVEVCVAGYHLDELGMVVDLGVLKGALRDVLATLDHTCLNEVPPFVAGVNPTAENLTLLIADHVSVGLEAACQGHVVRVRRVRVWESETSCVTYECSL